MSFPEVRMRRLRRSEGLRRLLRETRVAPADLIQPLFVVSGSNVDRPISSLPVQRHVSADVAAGLAAQAQARGVGGMLLFGLPDSKDEQGSSAWDDAGPVQSDPRHPDPGTGTPGADRRVPLRVHLARRLRRPA